MTTAGPVLFEAPGRVAATLADLAAACGTERPGAVCRELTKLHETVERGSLGELVALAREGRIPARGEFVLVVGAWIGGRPISGEAEADALEVARAEVERLVADGVARGDAARQVGAASGIPRRKLYGADGLQ